VSDARSPDVTVLRQGTEGLGTEPYAAALRERLPEHTVLRAATPAEERELVADAPVVTGIGIDEELLGHADRLELFACAFAGTDHLPTEALLERGVTVTNAGGIHVPGIAEQAVGYMLVFARNLHEGIRRQDRREWRHFQSGELAGSTVTVVGQGAIGTAVVERLTAFDAETVAVRHTPDKGGPADEVVGYDDVDGALARSEYVVLACPLTELTRGLIDAEALATLPPEAVVVNVARGGVVDTDALVAAIRRNDVRGAALDVTDPEPLPADHPLWGFGNVLITPHTGGHNPQHWERLAEIVADNVRALETGGALRNVVARP
jgi:phosphoglycerate dehydrogenase-like enzyme